MYGEHEDYCECNVKHLEEMELSSEFYETIDELISKEAKSYVKNEIKSYELRITRREEDIKRLERRNAELNQEIPILNIKINDLSSLIENKDEEIKELKAKIDSMDNEFFVGENCFRIKSRFIYSDCPECAGKKTVKALYNGKETEVSCPVCLGSGSDGRRRSFFPEKAKIKAVQFDDAGIEYAIMKDEGDWRFESEGYFFRTQEEAQAECDRLNINGVEE